MKMINRLALFCVLLALIGLPVFGEALQGGNYDLQPMDGYGSGVLEGGNYRLKDVKGAPFTGFTTGGNDDLYIGPIYVLEPGAGAATGEAPAGTVPLFISRDGDNIKISWEASVPDYNDPQIYVLIGGGSGSYTNDVAGWSGPYTPNSYPAEFDFSKYASGYVLHLDQVGAGESEVYYKGLQDGITAANISPDQNLPANTAYLASAWAVGKINITTDADGGLLLIGLPMFAGNVASTYPDQLGTNQTINLYPRAGGGLDAVAVTNSGIMTGSDFDILPTVGFWQKNLSDTAVTITFVGDLPKTDYTDDLESLDLSSNPLAKQLSSDTLGIDGDVIYPQSGSGLSAFTKDQGSWGQNFPAVDFYQGFWYRYSGNLRRWNIDHLTPDAVIEEYQ